MLPVPCRSTDRFDANNGVLLCTNRFDAWINGEFVGTIAISTILAVLISIVFSLTVVPAFASFLFDWPCDETQSTAQPFPNSRAYVASYLGSDAAISKA